MKFRHLRLTDLGLVVTTTIYLVILYIILFLAYTGNLPRQISLIPFHDVIGHFILYSIASYLGHRVFQRRKINLLSFSIPLWPLLFGIFTITEESLQSLSPNRTFSWIDMTASIFGLLFGYWIAQKSRKSK